MKLSLLALASLILLAAGEACDEEYAQAQIRINELEHEIIQCRASRIPPPPPPPALRNRSAHKNPVDIENPLAQDHAPRNPKKIAAPNNQFQVTPDMLAALMEQRARRKMAPEQEAEQTDQPVEAPEPLAVPENKRRGHRPLPKTPEPQPQIDYRSYLKKRAPKEAQG